MVTAMPSKMKKETVNASMIGAPTESAFTG